MRRHREKAAIYMLKRKASGETNLAHVWISDFEPPEL